LYQFYSKYYSF